MSKVLGVFKNSDTTRVVPAGAVIFHEGDAGDEMFGVIDGSVELRHGGRVVATIGPDDVFGEMALVDGSTRSATAVAADDVTLAVISKRHFLFMVHETPMFALQVMSSMAERLRQFG